jgi:hypothetical protein
VAFLAACLLDEAGGEGVGEVSAGYAYQEPCAPGANGRDDLEFAVSAIASTAIGELGFDGGAESLNSFEAGFDQRIEDNSRLRICSSHDRDFSLSVTNGQYKFPVKV